jgi:hypothetical protein
VKPHATVLSLFALAIIPLVSAKPPPEVQTRLDAWLKGQPGGVALAWVDADGVAFFQSGHFGPDDPRAITPDTQFEIGSVTKVFTALLLAESERAGTVIESAGALSVQTTGQEKISMFASAKDEFFCKAVNALISFQRDATGKVTGLLLPQNGGTQAAKKVA